MSDKQIIALNYLDYTKNVGNYRASLRHSAFWNEHKKKAFLLFNRNFVDQAALIGVACDCSTLNQRSLGLSS